MEKGSTQFCQKCLKITRSVLFRSQQKGFFFFYLSPFLRFSLFARARDFFRFPEAFFGFAHIYVRYATAYIIIPFFPCAPARPMRVDEVPWRGLEKSKTRARQITTFINSQQGSDRIAKRKSTLRNFGHYARNSGGLEEWRRDACAHINEQFFFFFLWSGILSSPASRIYQAATF